MLGVTPSLEDDFAIECDFTAGGIEEYFASGITEDRNVEKVVCEAWKGMGHPGIGPEWTRQRQCLTLGMSKRGGVQYVSIIRAKMAIRLHPLTPNTLGVLVIMAVMPPKAPIVMTALTAGSVVSSNLISMREAHGGWGLDQFC